MNQDSERSCPRAAIVGCAGMRSGPPGCHLGGSPVADALGIGAYDDVEVVRHEGIGQYIEGAGVRRGRRGGNCHGGRHRPGANAGWAGPR